MVRRDLLSWGLIALTVGCFVIGLFPQWNDFVDPENGDKVSEWRLGIWSSPAYYYEHREIANGGFKTESGVNLLSWSVLLIVGGAFSFENLRWRRFALRRRQEMPGLGRSEKDS
jgi:hypothetical protein